MGSEGDGCRAVSETLQKAGGRWKSHGIHALMVVVSYLPPTRTPHPPGTSKTAGSLLALAPVITELCDSPREVGG